MSEHDDMVSAVPESLTQDWAGHTLDMAGSLLIVVAAVILVSLALRHLQSRSSGTGGHLKIIQAISVGAKDRVLLVQVGVDQILMGVSAAGICHLHTLSEPVAINEEQQDNGVPSRSFADIIQKISGKQQP